MNNKETLQSNNTRLSSNNDSLNGLINKINSLPEPKKVVLQDKTLEITENGIKTVMADEGYDGLNSVEITTNIASSGGKFAPRHVRFGGFKGSELDEELANLDTSNLTSTASMFASNTSVLSVDVSNFDTSNVTDMGYMFYNNSSLTKLDLSSFDTSNVMNMTSMFEGCSSLDTVILGENFNTGVLGASVRVSSPAMFKNCTNLKTLVIKTTDFYLTYSTTFQNCNITDIYVPDEYVSAYAEAYKILLGSNMNFIPLSLWKE